MLAWLFMLACAVFVDHTFGMGAPQQAVGSPAVQIEDSKRHLGESFQAIRSLPTTQQKTLVKESNRSFSATLKSNVDLSSHEKKVAKKLSVGNPKQLITKISSIEGINLEEQPMSRALVLLNLSTQQVVVDHLPAYSNLPPSPGQPNGSTAALSPCAAHQFFISIIPVSRSSDLLRKVANSVGRVEVVNDANFKGTAFVVSKRDGILATACHVVSGFATYDSTTRRWALPDAEIVADFGETKDHLPAREFRVTGIAYVPNLKGCDAALIKVETKAIDGSSQLPEDVPIASPELYGYSSRIDVATIGYPGLSDAALQAPPLTTKTVDYFNCLRSEQPSIAKYTFAGWADPLESRESGEYHVFNHLAPTTGGQSGSPIIAVTDQGIGVIGIHYCCTGTPAWNEGPHQCEDWTVNDHPQEAIDLADLLAGAQSTGVINAGTIGPLRSNIEQTAALPRPPFIAPQPRAIIPVMK
jgi:hypothetical protein